jgi:hypothetical protein
VLLDVAQTQEILSQRRQLINILMLLFSVVQIGGGVLKMEEKEAGGGFYQFNLVTPRDGHLFNGRGPAALVAIV